MFGKTTQINMEGMVRNQPHLIAGKFQVVESLQFWSFNQTSTSLNFLPYKVIAVCIDSGNTTNSYVHCVVAHAAELCHRYRI